MDGKVGQPATSGWTIAAWDQTQSSWCFYFTHHPASHLHHHFKYTCIPQILNLSCASGSSYYYNIAKNQKCGRKLSESGKRRSSKLLVLFQELLRNQRSFLHACHTWSTTDASCTSSPKRNMILNGSFHWKKVPVSAARLLEVSYVT